MAESVLERAAIAAWRAHAAHELGEPVPDSWEGVAAPKEFYRETVRAVLAAIREPDEATTAAGALNLQGVIVDADGHIKPNAVAVWQAMLDAITKGGG